MAKIVERRRTRSLFRGEAADLYLRALSRAWGLRAAVLADAQGLPVAAAGPRFALDPLSAYGAHRASTVAGSSTKGDGPRSVPLVVGCWPFSLTVLGAGELPWDKVERDLARILDLDA